MKQQKMKFGMHFQLDILNMMVNSTGFLLLCKKYVRPNFFSTDRFEYFANKIYKFYDNYKTLPDKTFFTSICRDRKDRTFVKLLTKARLVKEDYVRDELKEFIQRNLFIEFYQQSGRKFNSNDIESAFELMMNGSEQIQRVDFNEDKYDFLLKDFDRRLVDRNHKINTQKNFKVPTGIHPLDRILKGGISGGEVFIWVGDAKSGKSFALIHQGQAAVKRYITTLHIQLEGKHEQVMDRYDSSFTGSLYDAVKNNEIPPEYITKMEKIIRRRRMRDLIVKTYEDWDSASVLDIERDYLDLVSKGFDIKLILIDYLELMRSRKNFGGDNSERMRQQSIARDLKTFAVKHNVAIGTASQSTRVTQEQADDPNFFLTSKNISEDYGKVRVVDGLVTINRTTSERKRGIARLYIDTVRDNPANRLIMIKQDLDRSRFYIRTSTIKKVKR